MFNWLNAQGPLGHVNQVILFLDQETLTLPILWDIYFLLYMAVSH